MQGFFILKDFLLVAVVKEAYKPYFRNHLFKRLLLLHMSL